LIISRVIQGIGAAMLISVGPALITRSFPESERGRGLSMIAMVVSVGLMLGPPLGGFIIALSSWRWIFLVNLPVCLIGLVLAHRFFGDLPILNPDKKISVPGSLALSLSLLGMMISILLYSRNQIGNLSLLGILLFSILMLILFIYYERQPKTSVIGLEIFKNRLFVFSGLSQLLVFISLISVTVLMPFYLEEIKNLRPDQVGLYLMAIPLSAFFFARFAGHLSDKFPARIISTIGVSLVLIGIVQMQRLDVVSSSIEIIAPLIFMGVGMALFNTPNTSAIMGSVARHRAGIAAGMIATIRTLGISLGVGIAVSIFSFYRNSYTEDGFESINAFMYGYNSVYKIILIPIVLAIIFSFFRGENLKPNAKR